MNPTPQHKEEWEETIENCFLTERMTDWPVPTVRVNPDTLKHVVSTLCAEAKQEGREEIAEAVLKVVVSTDWGSNPSEGVEALSTICNLEAAKSN